MTSRPWAFSCCTQAATALGVFGWIHGGRGSEDMGGPNSVNDIPDKDSDSTAYLTVNKSLQFGIANHCKAYLSEGVISRSKLVN